MRPMSSEDSPGAADDEEQHQQHRHQEVDFSALAGTTHLDLPDVMPSPPGSRHSAHHTMVPPPMLDTHTSSSSASASARAAKQVAALQARLGKSVIDLEQAQETQSELRLELERERKLRLVAQDQVRKARQFEAERRAQVRGVVSRDFWGCLLSCV
jgi:hypothetical protein